MEALKLTVKVRPDGTVEWPELLPKLPAGEAEVILLVSSRSEGQSAGAGKGSAAEWPRLRVGRWKADTLRREDFYGDMGR